MKRTGEKCGAVAPLFRAPYDKALAYVEANRARLLKVIQRAWASPPDEELCRRIGSLAHRRGASFDEVLYWLWERLCQHGTGALWSPDVLPEGREEGELCHRVTA